MKHGRCSMGLPKTCIPIFSFRIKLMAEGELKDMEQFFDDLSDSFSGTEPEVHKTSVVGMKLLRGAESAVVEASSFLRGICHSCGVHEQAE